MKRLILMRHAKTEAWTEGVDDHARALTQLGHETASAMAAVLKSEGWSPDIAAVSTARRTRETWKHLQPVFETCDAKIEDDLYLAGERGIMDVISDIDGAQTVMIVGHNPGIHDLAVRIMREAGSCDHQASMRLATKMPTGAAALFEANEDGAFLPEQFRLKNFIRPKDIL